MYLWGHRAQGRSWFGGVHAWAWCGRGVQVCLLGFDAAYGAWCVHARVRHDTWDAAAWMKAPGLWRPGVCVPVVHRPLLRAAQCVGIPECN